MSPILKMVSVSFLFAAISIPGVGRVSASATSGDVGTSAEPRRHARTVRSNTVVSDTVVSVSPEGGVTTDSHVRSKGGVHDSGDSSLPKMRHFETSDGANSNEDNERRATAPADGSSTSPGRDDVATLHTEVTRRGSLDTAMLRKNGYSIPTAPATKQKVKKKEKGKKKAYGEEEIGDGTLEDAIKIWAAGDENRDVPPGTLEHGYFTPAAPANKGKVKKKVIGKKKEYKDVGDADTAPTTEDTLEDAAREAGDKHSAIADGLAHLKNELNILATEDGDSLDSKMEHSLVEAGEENVRSGTDKGGGVSSRVSFIPPIELDISSSRRRCCNVGGGHRRRRGDCKRDYHPPYVNHRRRSTCTLAPSPPRRRSSSRRRCCNVGGGHRRRRGDCKKDIYPPYVKHRRRSTCPRPRPRPRRGL